MTRRIDAAAKEADELLRRYHRTQDDIS
jgi:hypothetical protein